MAQGLKQEMGLKDPKTPSAGSSQQASQFKASFQATMKPVNECLQYTVANAEKSKHEAMQTKKDNAYRSYQAALSKIDPADESKAQADINNVLASSNSLSSEATTLKKETEKAVKAWQEKEPTYEELVQQLEELEKWEDEQAGALRESADTIRTQADEKKYLEATAAVDEFQTELTPRYEEYEVQSEAKEEYDKKKPEVEQKTAATGGGAAGGKTDETQKKIDETKSQMEQSADEKDYVDSNEKLEVVEELTEELSDQAFVPTVKPGIDNLTLKLNEKKTFDVEVSNAASAPPGYMYEWRPSASSDVLEVTCSGGNGPKTQITVLAKKVGHGSFDVAVVSGDPNSIDSKQGSATVNVAVAIADVTWGTSVASDHSREDSTTPTVSLDSEITITADVTEVENSSEAPMTLGVSYGGAAVEEVSAMKWQGNHAEWRVKTTQEGDLNITCTAQIPGMSDITAQFPFTVIGGDFIPEVKATPEKVKMKLNEEVEVALEVSNANDAPPGTIYEWDGSINNSLDFASVPRDNGPQVTYKLKSTRIGKSDAQFAATLENSASGSTSVAVEVEDAEVAWEGSIAEDQGGADGPPTVDVNGEIEITATISNVEDPENAPILVGVSFSGSAGVKEDSAMDWKGDTVTWKLTATNPGELIIKCKAEPPGMDEITAEFTYQVAADLQWWKEKAIACATTITAKYIDQAQKVTTAKNNYVAAKNEHSDAVAAGMSGINGVKELSEAVVMGAFSAALGAGATLLTGGAGATIVFPVATKAVLAFCSSAMSAVGKQKIFPPPAAARSSASDPEKQLDALAAAISNEGKSLLAAVAEVQDALANGKAVSDIAGIESQDPVAAVNSDQFLSSANAISQVKKQDISRKMWEPWQKQNEPQLLGYVDAIAFNRGAFPKEINTLVGAMKSQAGTDFGMGARVQQQYDLMKASRDAMDEHSPRL